MNELQPLPEMVEIKPESNFQIWCRIKKDSKYYRQGTLKAEDPKSPALFFRMAFVHSVRLDGPDQYCLEFNSNRYRAEDLEIYLVPNSLAPAERYALTLKGGVKIR